jgi:hypothetical protein
VLGVDEATIRRDKASANAESNVNGEMEIEEPSSANAETAKPPSERELESHRREN